MNEQPPQCAPLFSPDLHESWDFSPEAPLESWRLAIPAKGACYVMEDAHGKPVLLATCADLRHALVGKLGPQSPEQGPAKKNEYRDLVRRVRWRPTHSRFEADWAYLENAIALWPKTYRNLVKQWRAHWVGIDLSETHPRFTAPDRPLDDPHPCFGPFPESQSAKRFVELLEDLFDLCRYHAILVQAPHGQACAYKQMGRCPAPCDGSITMAVYRQQLQQALAFIAEPREKWVEHTSQRMKAAADAQRFEEAARCKRMLERARAAAVHHATPLNRMRFIALQKGERKQSLRAFLVAPGVIADLGPIEPNPREETIARLAERAGVLNEQPLAPLDEPGRCRTALAAWHLLGGGGSRGVFLQAEEARDIHQLRAALEAMAKNETEP